MKRSSAAIITVALLGGVMLPPPAYVAQAQPAKGAPAAFERVREVMNNRFKDMKLVGDPDQDFAAVLIAHHEDLIFLAKTQLEFGADRSLRQLAQKILDEQQRQISEVKEWQVRNRQPDYRAQPDQPPHGTGPLDQKQAGSASNQRQAAATGGSPSQVSSTAASAKAAANLPVVSGTVEKVDTAAGKLTLEHGPIPNLSMDSMTMVFRVADPAMLRGLKARDKVQFQADRVNGQLSVVKIQKGK